MAKIAYSKLGLSKMVNKEPSIIEFNDQQIEVVQYLPIEKKLDLISDIINSSLDDNTYYNPCRIEIFMLTKIIEAYTNLTITDKQKEDIFKFYDQLVASGFAEKVLDNIPAVDYNFIHRSVTKTIKNIYQQKNSALGILESISTDYSNLNLDASEIQKKLADPDNLDFLKAVLTKLG
jgi:hypothetical protein